MGKELKPCPICGAKASEPEKINRPPTKGRPIWETGCVNYCIFMKRGSKKELIESWNTRTSFDRREAEKFFNDWLWKSPKRKTCSMGWPSPYKRDAISMIMDATKAG